MYVNLGLLLRSLRACSLGVVLVKVARCLHTYLRGTAIFSQTLRQGLHQTEHDQGWYGDQGAEGADEYCACRQ